MIRNAAIEDSRAIAEIHVASWQHTYVGQVPDAFLAGLSVPAREAIWRESFSYEGHQLLLAEDEGLAAGFVSFGRSRDKDLNPEHTGEINALYLRPECQGRGLGGELWRQAIQALGDQGFDQVVVWVLETNSGARQFYETKGCSVDGTSKHECIGGKEVTELRYRLRLE
jgi:ribosomal protein S18 acetylase RimI-like enzyme